MEKNKLENISLNIYGKNFYLVSDKDTDYTKKIAKYLSDEMRKIANEAGNEDYDKIAIIAALNIIDDFFKLKEKNEKIEHRLNELINKIHK